MKYMISFIFSVVISLFCLTAIVHSKETIVVHSKYATTDTAYKQLQFVVNALNDASNKYNFRISILNGAFGEASIRRSIVDARSNVKNIIFTSVDVFTINKELENFDKNLLYNKNEDYILLQGLAMSAHGVVSALPFTNINDLVAHLKNQKEFFYGYSSNSIVTKMSMDAFIRHHQLQNGKPVIFRTQNELHFSVLNREVHFAVTTPDVLISSGDIRLLLSTSRTRSPFYPDVPTGLELGISDFVYNPQTFFALPKEFSSMAKEIEQELRKICLSDEYSELALSLISAFPRN